MAKCNHADMVALSEAGPLLRFAAERVKDLDPKLSLAIATARAAADSDQWTPEISQRFWTAFSKLCDLIQPVTMDCLAAADRTVISSKWSQFWRGRQKISIAERSSHRHMFALIVLISITLPLQLYVWTSTNLSKKIDDLIAADVGSLFKLSDSFRTLDDDYRNLIAAMSVPSLGNAQLQRANPEEPPAAPAAANPNTEEKVESHEPGEDVTQQGPNEEDRQTQRYRNLKLEEKLTANKIQDTSVRLSSSLERILYEAYFLDDLSSIFLGNTRGVSEAERGEWFSDYPYAMARLFEARTNVYKIQEMAALRAGIVGSFILPILFGVMGAVAFVIRTISDQIRTTTFSQHSPIRHVMRVVLGGLAGIVVGLFNGLSGQLSLPPLALAFLAGYGVEAVFSMFDGIIEKFRQAKP